MGALTVKTVEAAADLALVGACDLGDDLGATIRDGGAQVVVDFTTAAAALASFEVILASGASAVVGTSGFGEAEVERARELCALHDRPAVVAPNFALASVLMARYAADAAKYIPHVELIEAHHDTKPDAPSGTALKFAADIAAARAEVPPAPDAETVPGVRGGVVQDVRVHALRLPGLLARMECVFGGVGDTMTLRHDTLTRESFMPGVLLAVRRVLSCEGLVYGLEHLL
jgi:4-hydroxy-tetrahydrodipicolinate reductase